MDPSGPDDVEKLEPNRDKSSRQVRRESKSHIGSFPVIETDRVGFTKLLGSKQPGIIKKC